MMGAAKWAMLCKLVAEAFDSPDWVWERKHDGLRMRMAYGWPYGARLTARSGADKTPQFPELAAFRPPDCVRSMTIDGEVVSAEGLPFQEFVQRRANRGEEIQSFARDLPAKFMAFDLLELDGEDLSRVPFERRRQLLLLSLPTDCAGLVEPVSQFDSGVDAWRRAVEYGWEGVVGKRLDGVYEPGRRGWLKVKVWLPPSDYYVIGFTAGTGKRAGAFGAMMLGAGRLERDEDGEVMEFDHVGDVGTGLDDAELERLDGLRRTMAPYSRLEFGQAIRVTGNSRDMLKVSVKAVERTNAGKLRFPVYLGQAKEA